MSTIKKKFIFMNVFKSLTIEFKKGKMKYTRRDGYERCEQAL